MSATAQRIVHEARELLPGAIELRRRLHAHPELGLELPRTEAAVLEALEGLDLSIVKSPATSGIVATLTGGRPGPTVLLRADMDALPVAEETGLDFSSREPGRMHACGHDAHAAMLVGAARLLHGLRDELAGRVRLFFQPGEEGHDGARRMLGEGLLEDDPPAAAFALHIDPRLTAGRVSSRPGTLMASADFFEIELTGRGGHASMPHDANDPVPVACELVGAMQTFVTRRIDVFEPAVVTVTRIEGADAINAIPTCAKLHGTLRAAGETSRQAALAGLRRLAEGLAAAHEMRAAIQMGVGYPPTVNDPGRIELARRVAGELLGEDAWEEMPSPMMAAEDFSHLLNRYPGAMLRLGVRPPGEGPAEPCHSGRMVIEEEGLAAGIALLAGLALRFDEEAGGGPANQDGAAIGR